MPHRNALLERLANSSARLNKGLLVLGALVLLLLGISYVGVKRMIEEQHDSVRLHFARLMENIREQELFLQHISRRGAEGKRLPDIMPPPYSQRPMPDEGPDIYEGRGLPFSLPYSLKIDPDRIAIDQRPKVLALGAYLAAYYSAFWSASHYQSPQVVLINGPDNFDLAVPSAGRLRDTAQTQIRHLVDVLTGLNQRLHAQNAQRPDLAVHWEPYQATESDSVAPSLLAYVRVDLGKSALSIEGANTWVILGALLNLSQINDIERLMHWSIYDDFTLITPRGLVLTGAVKPERALHEGANFTRDGLVFKLNSPGEQHWTAIYVISVQSFLDYAQWPLLFLLTLVVAMLGCSRAITRWYRTQVIQPAQSAHASIAESEAFSRALIDTAPTGLCVIRRSDHRVLLQNQQAQQWHDSEQLMHLLTSHSEAGHTDLELGGRHLHVAFVPTRYQGQDAWLCALHDVTRHVEDAAALEDARQAADSANAAKSRFLATMSHEIRTPLYGVLGTVELLGLTPLTARQQDYLQTIQRSSATLFQLISDVLDVSKIEAGQMTLELQDFCPLELTEDAIRTYSASARVKGLQLYACIDPALPERLRGDPMRIRQILNNLLSNAIKFTDSGRVLLRVTVLESVAGRAHVQWQVLDSGVGITQEQQRYLFDAFYQVSGARDQAGAGLGLAICKWLCQLMAGELSVFSEPGLGSCFTLQLALDHVPGVLADCPVFAPRTPTVYVRGQATDQARHVIAWLERFGLKCKALGADAVACPAPLVELAPPRSNASAPWPGPRIIATAGGPNPSQPRGADQEVDANDIRAIAWAVHHALHGESPAGEPLAHAQVSNLNLHALIAEDNVINSAIIKEQLEVLGCTAVVAANGEQALTLWPQGHFDVVLTDVNMPVMDGYQLASALRQLDQTVPIIGITANALREEGQRCTAAGMNAWMVKPLNLTTLRAHLEKYCNIDLPPADAAQLRLSPQMRALFVTTLRQDIDTTLTALSGGDAMQVAQQLHSMAGALGAVQNTAMATAFVELENRLHGMTLTRALGLEIRQHLARLGELLDTLETFDAG
ncbi:MULTISPECIES: hybrid sensor histidine kinase/response regulator [Pseudomonas]|uniref:hybrid sensor histidine kinase/response regulator n=1 Tax=Pseudomonas TaxID=286 RepID=UPI0006D3A864|nr:MULTISPECIES: hybrid sensor histidine kinase/response regulator [Pseudomonas]